MIRKKKKLPVRLPRKVAVKKHIIQTQTLFNVVNDVLKMSDEFVNEEYCIESAFAERAAHQLRLRNISQKTIQDLIKILQFPSVLSVVVEGLSGEQRIYAVDYLNQDSILTALTTWRANVHLARYRTRWLREDRLERYRICFPNAHIIQEPKDPTREIVSYYLTTKGNLGKVAVLVGVPHHELQRTIEKNRDLKERIDSCNESMLDDVEEQMINLARGGDFRAAKYVLDHKAKKRGYGRMKSVSPEDFQQPRNGVTTIEVDMSEADARQAYIDTLKIFDT